MSNKAGTIVPFGKYKGQPVEALAEDRAYIDWMLAQGWVKERHPEFHTLIINNFAEPNETPEHNALQVLFLDDEFCRRFVEKVADKRIDKAIKYIGDHWRECLTSVEKENEERVARIKDLQERLDRGVDRYLLKDLRERLQNETHLLSEWPQKVEQHRERLLEPVPRKFKFERAFEVAAIDVILKMTFHEVYGINFMIEMKPSVGDDYPAVLRLMNNMHVTEATLGYSGHARMKVLFLDSYTGIGASKEQFEAIFRHAGIAVVYRRDVVI